MSENQPPIADTANAELGVLLCDHTAYLEGLATAARCPRHRPHMRACAYAAGKPCYCREMTELIYGKR